MAYSWIVYAYLGIGVSSALVSGVFLSFSDFIMRALKQSNPLGAIESMQEINVTVLRSIFLTKFFLLFPETIVMSFVSAYYAPSPVTSLVFAGTGMYIFSVILVTIVGNVPMNEKLRKMPAESPETIAYWRHYGSRWTKLNHVRTIGSLLTAVLFLLAALALVAV